MILNRKRFLKFCIALIFSLETSVFGADLSCTPAKNIIHYQVQSGETISSILFNRSLSPLWGRHGYVEKVYALNKRHIKKNGQVFFGQRIRISAGCEINAKSLVSSEIESSGIVRLGK
jgi:hypothetical protein